MEILAEHPEYDMLEYPVYVHKGSREQHVLSFVPQTYTDRNRYWLDTKAYSHAYAWNKIYRQGVFQNIRYPKGKLFEDVWIYPEILRQVGIIATTDKGMYIYTYNPDSITARPEGAVLKELLSAHLTKLEDQAIDYRYYAYLLNIQMDVYERTGDEPILPILPYWGTLKLALLHIIGLKKTCQLNKILHRLSRRN